MKTETKTRRHLVFHAAGVLLVGAALAASLTLASTRNRAEAAEATTRTEALALGPAVQVVTVKKSPPGRVVTLSGEVHAYQQATLYAKVSGYLKLIKVDKGDHVKAGEVLGVIEAPETGQQVASKRADLAIKRLTDARVRSLVTEGLASVQDRDRAAADVAIATADLSYLNELQGYQVIRAPFAGVITARHADPGALLQAATATTGALSLVDIADLSRVRVMLYLAQSEAVFVKEGDAVTVWTDQRPDRKVAAKITRFTRQLDTRSRTMLTEVDVDNTTAGFYPGTFLRASLTLATPEALSIQADALVFRSGGTFVARVTDGRAAFVPVQIGDTDGQSVRIRAGLAEGDTVIVHPGDEVAEGARVQVAQVATK